MEKENVMERRPQGLFIMFTSTSSDVAYWQPGHGSDFPRSSQEAQKVARQPTASLHVMHTIPWLNQVALQVLLTSNPVLKGLRDMRLDRVVPFPLSHSWVDYGKSLSFEMIKKEPRNSQPSIVEYTATRLTWNIVCKSPGPTEPQQSGGLSKGSFPLSFIETVSPLPPGHGTLLQIQITYAENPSSGPSWLSSDTFPNPHHSHGN